MHNIARSLHYQQRTRAFHSHLIVGSGDVSFLAAAIDLRSLARSLKDGLRPSRRRQSQSTRSCSDQDEMRAVLEHVFYPKFTESPR